MDDKQQLEDFWREHVPDEVSDLIEALPAYAEFVGEAFRTAHELGSMNDVNQRFGAAKYHVAGAMVRHLVESAEALQAERLAAGGTAAPNLRYGDSTVGASSTLELPGIALIEPLGSNERVCDHRPRFARRYPQSSNGTHFPSSRQAQQPLPLPEMRQCQMEFITTDAAGHICLAMVVKTAALGDGATDIRFYAINAEGGLCEDVWLDALNLPRRDDGATVDVRVNRSAIERLRGKKADDEDNEE